jgi:hypothetical protein
MLDKNTINDLMQRRGRAVARSANWVKVKRSAYALSQPNRNIFLQQISEGALRNFYVYDGTLVLATRRFVNKMQSGLVPQNINWFQFALADKFIREMREEFGAQFGDNPNEEQTKQIEAQVNEFKEKANRVLQARTDAMFEYIRASNFDAVINEALYDMAVSTGALQINEGDDDEPLIFASIPADRVYYSEGPWGSIDAVFRDFIDIELATAQQMWKNFTVPKVVMSNRDPYQLLTLYECSYYNYDRKEYCTVIIEKSTNEICYEKHEDSWPFVIFRWYKLAGEIEGRGPVLDAFPSAATINKVMEDEIMAADLMAKPIYLGFSDGLFNPYTFKLAANTIIPVNPIAAGGQLPIVPLPKAGDVGFGAIVLNDLRAQIDKLMFNTSLGPIEDAPELTATEVAIRQNEMVEDAAASFARLQRELFFPLIKRILWILKKKGLISPFEVNGKVVDVKFTTPLSLGKGQLDVNQFMTFFQHLAAILGPEKALIPINVTMLPKFFGENLNVHMPLIRSQPEIEKILAELEQEARQQQQQQMEMEQKQGAMKDARTQQQAA